MSASQRPNWEAYLRIALVGIAAFFAILLLPSCGRDGEEKKQPDEATKKLDQQLNDAIRDRQAREQEAQRQKQLQEESLARRRAEERERERQREASKSEKRQKVAQYAIAQFTQFPLTPRLHISPSLGIAPDAVSFLGEEFDKVRNAYNAKEWLRLYALLMDNELVWPEEEAEINHALHRLEDTRCFLLIKPNTTLTREDYALVVLFVHDSCWIDSPELKWDSGFEYPHHWEKHPDGAGYFYQLCLRYSDVFIIHAKTEEPLHRDIKFLQECHWNILQSIRTRKKLSELGDAAYTAELLRLKNVDMAYCAMLLSPSGMHAPFRFRQSPPSHYVKGSFAFLANNPDYITLSGNFRQIEKSIKLSSSADIQACINELHEQLKKYPKFESDCDVQFIRFNKYLRYAKIREQFAANKGSLAFLANCRDSEAALRNVNWLLKLQHAITETSSAEIQACINELNEQIKKCPQLTMPSGLRSYESYLKGARDSLYGYLLDAKMRERIAADEVQEQRWQTERETALAKCLAEAVVRE